MIIVKVTIIYVEMHNLKYNNGKNKNKEWENQ